MRRIWIKTSVHSRGKRLIDLAKMLKMSPGNLSHIVSGTTPKSIKKTLDKIEKVFEQWDLEEKPVSDG